MTKKRRKRGSGRVYPRGNSWNIAYYYMGKQQRERVGPIGPVTKGIAEKALTVRLAEIAQGKFDLEKTKSNRSFYDLIDKYLKYAKVSQKSFNRTKVICNHLKGFFGNIPLSDITPFEIENYKQKRLSEVVKNSTVNRELNCLKSMFNLALDWGIFHSYNPVKRVKYFKTRKYPHRVLDEIEFYKLYIAAAPHLKPILLCAINTGMRKSEILNLKWDDINVNDEKITVKESKNYDYRVIHMNETLKNMFSTTNKCSEYIFTFNNKPIKECHRSFNTAIRIAGIKHCRLHDLRHTFATKLVSEGADLVTVQDILGHKSIQMTRRYAHPTSENKKNAVNSLAKIFKIPAS